MPDWKHESPKRPGQDRLSLRYQKPAPGTQCNEFRDEEGEGITAVRSRFPALWSWNRLRIGHRLPERAPSSMSLPDQTSKAPWSEYSRPAVGSVRSTAA